jgi:hypothetical protein
MRTAARRAAFRRWLASIVKSTAFGAALLGGIVALRAIAYGVTRGRPSDQVSVGEVIAWAALAGGVAGFAYGILGAPFRRRRPVGPYLAGLVAGAGYAFALVGILVPHFEHVPVRWDGTAWIMVLLVTVAGGLALGFQFAKEEDGLRQRLPNER